jgi:hypothetical protein
MNFFVCVARIEVRAVSADPSIMAIMVSHSFALSHCHTFSSQAIALIVPPSPGPSTYFSPNVIAMFKAKFNSFGSNFDVFTFS